MAVRQEIQKAKNMKLESLSSAKFQPLTSDQLGLLKGGEYNSYSTGGMATVNGKKIDYANDCVTQWDDGTWHAVYVLPDGTGVHWNEKTVSK
jgi:hypothetical protein